MSRLTEAILLMSFRRKHRCRAAGNIARAPNAGRGHDDLLADRLKRQRQLEALAQRRIDVGHLRVGKASRRCGDRVRAASPNARDAVGARSVGLHGRPRPAGNVNDRNRGVRHRRARSGDRPADRRGRFLRERWSRDERCGGKRHEKGRASAQQNGFFHGKYSPAGNEQNLNGTPMLAISRLRH